MMNNRLLNTLLNDLLPLYANGRTNRFQRKLVEFVLARDAAYQNRLDALLGVREALHSETRLPANNTWARIHAQLQTAVIEPATVIRPSTWRLGMSLAVLLLVLVWFAFPPKVVLEWTVEGAAPEGFRVYRSLQSGSNDFLLVEEIASGDTAGEYRFVDLQLLPGRNYTYKIEAVAQNGEAISSELVLTDGAGALPSQLALLMTFLVSLYGLRVFFSERKHWPAAGLQLRLS